MTTKDIIEKLELKAMTEAEDREVDGVIITDMVSDVMAGAKSGNLWVTIQTHKSIVPAANLVDVSAVIITHGKQIPKETIDMANKHEIAILYTEMATYELVGKLLEAGLKPK